MLDKESGVGEALLPCSLPPKPTNMSFMLFVKSTLPDSAQGAGARGGGQGCHGGKLSGFGERSSRLCPRHVEQKCSKFDRNSKM